jgi:trans-aconitate 2-methyltransferase
MGTPWDARTYDRTSGPQQAWASEVLGRLEGIAPDATALDVGCGTGRVTEALLALVPRGRVLALDASEEMVALARTRLGDRAEVWCRDVLDLDLDEPVDAIVSTATLQLVAGATDASPERRRVRANVDPRGAPRSLAPGATRVVRRRRGRSASAAGLRSP